ncbi:Nidogen-1 [Collichthys lucidus]|uniref:Nidogen-1 n=1 Tax=Collichthys lucidus TaxID=240159 RepID=A0A4V6ARP9_COLLU|nr:Nidogen-1 [Collichthys lucidus]
MNPCSATAAQDTAGVDRNGQEISGTRSGPDSRPMCFDNGGVQPTIGPTTRPDVHPLPPGSHLLYTQSGRIEHIPLKGHDLKKDDAKPLLHLPEKVIIGVAYDCVEKMVYWTEITSPSISKASIEGGEPTEIIQSDLGSPEGITIDHLGRTMFWTDSMKDRIEVASLDGSQRRVIINSDLVNPRAVIADPPNGNLYWADWNRDAPKIETSWMDGTNRRVLVKDDLGLPNGLTYDSQSSMLCWADAGTHKMECMHPARGDRRQVMEGIQYPFGMTSFGKNIYYTDWQRDAVVAVDRYTSKESDHFQPQKRTKLYGIATAYAQCPSGQNYCAVNNGGCDYLCLATPTGRSCKCPDNAVGGGCVERDSEY